MHFVYILKSQKDNCYYIGCTNNVVKRLDAHNSGKTQSIRHRRPFEIVWTESHITAENAYKRERQIKAYKGGDGFKKLINGGVA